MKDVRTIIAEERERRERDGGAAFPVSLEVVESGMTLRDWFAGQAMISALSAPRLTGTPSAEEGAANVAKVSYFIADAMLAERARCHE